MSGSPRPIFALAHPLVRSSFAVAGVRLEIHGRERALAGQNYLFAANHVSNADPPVLFVAIGRDVRALAKAEIFRVPVLGALLRRAGMIPVERGERERAVEAVDRAAESLASGVDFLVFVEGTRSPDGRLQELKKGPFVMAIKAGVPVLPVVVRGTREVQPKGSMRIRPGTVRVDFLEPIDTAGLGLEDRDDLRARVAAAMRRTLGDGPQQAVEDGGLQ